ncbi:MAG: hypothetical protein PWQ29_1664 [Verrucomicrobiota bacterium]|jgi:hypothetical protein|nr:hypothetical protein [Verrucomicrobiota bacterium]MDK2964270.1 hypothetical protein [Verrucomicrobiota bacterium]
MSEIKPCPFCDNDQAEEYSAPYFGFGFTSAQKDRRAGVYHGRKF